MDHNISAYRINAPQDVGLYIRPQSYYTERTTTVLAGFRNKGTGDEMRLNGIDSVLRLMQFCRTKLNLLLPLAAPAISFDGGEAPCNRAGPVCFNG
jgi:hypothetical protein